MLTAERVQKTYRTMQSHRSVDVVALRETSFVANEGEFISMIGPSGCGKTTLLKMCAGLVEPSSGSVEFRKTGKTTPPGSFGMVFQTPNLLPWRTVLKNVLLAADVRRLPKAASIARARELLDLVGLTDVSALYPRQLSGGMQQRVSIARALLHEPDLLFMDEPFGALDAMTRDDMNVELQAIHLASHKTVLFVTHSIREAVFLSDRIFVFSSRPGELLADIQIEIARPRPVTFMTSPQMALLEDQVRRALEIGSIKVATDRSPHDG